jgi:hypothetical protein
VVNQQTDCSRIADRRYLHLTVRVIVPAVLVLFPEVTFHVDRVGCPTATAATTRGATTAGRDPTQKQQQEDGTYPSSSQSGDRDDKGPDRVSPVWQRQVPNAIGPDLQILVAGGLVASGLSASTLK